MMKSKPSIQEALQNLMKKSITVNILNDNKLKLKYETEAVSVIKNKIKHFEKTGNKRKLAIYQSKLNGKQPIISNLRKMIK